ncbi:MAG TPA: hypothetical protein VIH76_08995 [Candidatus Acidoferrales bacterium]
MKVAALPFVVMCAVIMVLPSAGVAMGQSNIAGQSATPSREELAKLQATMPSDEEISELLAKADEKVSVFEQAVRLAKPFLDKIDTKYATNYLDAASTAHYLIQATNKNGTSAYRLVGVLTTLDDLSYDAATGSVFLMGMNAGHTEQGKSPDLAAQGALITLTASGTACNDIAALLMHATLRFVDVEEKLLGMLLPKDS